MDTTGYVVYAPTLSVAGLRNCAPVHELNRMLTGAVMAATSQLNVDRPFVLRHLARGHDADVLKKTLKADEYRRFNELTQKELAAAVSGAPADMSAKFQRYAAIELRLAGVSLGGGLACKLGQKDMKKLQKERRELLEGFDGGAHAFLAAAAKEGEAGRKLAEINGNESALKEAWAECIQWLTQAPLGAADDDGAKAVVTESRGTRGS